MTHPDLSVGLIEPSDWEAANDLHNRIFNTSRTLDQWRWEFGGPKGEPPIMAVTKLGSEILGTQALIPIEFASPSGAFLTAKSEETLLDPTLRGLGLFERMYAEVLPAAAQRGIRVIWGYTPATKAFDRVGFVAPWSTRQLFFPLSSGGLSDILASGATSRPRVVATRSAAAIASTLSKVSLAARQAVATSKMQRSDSHIDFTVLERPPKDADEFATFFASRWGSATINRTSEYLDWRVFRNPHVKASMVAASVDGRTTGWVLFSLAEDSMGYLVDVVVADVHRRAEVENEVMDGLLLRAVSTLRNCGAVGIRGWANGEGAFTRRLRARSRRLGFWFAKRGEPMVARSVGEVGGQLDQVIAGYHSRLFTEGLVG